VVDAAIPDRLQIGPNVAFPRRFGYVGRNAREGGTVSEQLEQVQNVLTHVRHQVAKVIIGQSEVVDRALIAIITGRHALIEGVPGVAKTLLVRALAQLLGCEFHRVQFTTDMMPADIIGSYIFNPKLNDFTLVKGPVFTTFLLADEINRAPARTQSALLQAMQEHQVSIGRETYPLSSNFVVFATQNPIDFDGTYPLPEAQKDRFLLKISMGCPNEEEELELAQRTLTREAPEALLEDGVIRPILTPERLIALRQTLETIQVPPEVTQYIVAIARRTRSHSSIKVGAGPRATQALALASRARAAIEGRESVNADDVKWVALGCLEHRIILKREFVEEGLTCPQVIDHILQSVRAPK
jgi:MoxR-like ATPase